ncbi:hypothetical protein [Massilia pseudoviolaceinigra]|uniref:hypothetical protein n=1 Tax=Massilia pseudoviolaceinigra TaxID=3057165 RepID=UPI0027966D3E|nr:hypothetical protein [Massilia sp. CCM 9206]MDQ1921659.1 hypothetical protein [Massilia sp. CCM 9206]
MLTFRPGEVAIMCNARLRPEMNGMACTITQPLGEYFVSGLGYRFHRGYEVRTADGGTYFQFPHQLRKKRPPGAEDAGARQAMLDCIERTKRPIGLET